MRYGNIDMHGDGTWIVYMHGERGDNPFDSLAAIIKAGKERIEAMGQSAAALESITATSAPDRPSARPDNRSTRRSSRQGR